MVVLWRTVDFKWSFQYSDFLWWYNLWEILPIIIWSDILTVVISEMPFLKKTSQKGENWNTQREQQEKRSLLTIHPNLCHCSSLSFLYTVQLPLGHKLLEAKDLNRASVLIFCLFYFVSQWLNCWNVNILCLLRFPLKMFCCKVKDWIKTSNYDTEKHFLIMLSVFFLPCQKGLISSNSLTSWIDTSPE